MNNKFNIGTKIKNMRKSMGLTQEQLAERLEIDYKYLSKIENGLHLPSYKTLTKISSVLGVKFEDFNEQQKVECVNPLFTQSLKILNSALDDSERKYYLDALKLAHKGINLFRNK